MGLKGIRARLRTCVVIGLMVMATLSLSPFLYGEAYPTDYTEFSLEELMDITVFGASRFDQKVSEVPSFVSMVTSDEIKKYGYRTLADILNSLSGFHVIYDRTYNYIGSRGLGRAGDFNARYLVLIDGHRINDNIYDSTYAGTDLPLDVDLIDRVEVMRGPSSTVYGSNAFLGVINIVTRKGEDFDGAEVSASAGSFDTYTGRYSFGKQFPNGFEMVLSGSALDSRGDTHYYKEFDDLSTNNGIMRNGDSDKSGSAFAKLSYKDFVFTGAFGRRTKGIPTAPYETDFTNQNEGIDERGFLDLKYTRNIDDSTTIKGRVFYDHYRYKGTWPFDGILNKDYALGRWWGGDIMLIKRLFTKHKVSVGAEYTFNARQDQRNYDEDPHAVYLDDERNSTNWAVYIQDTYSVRDNLIFDMGVRYDHYDFTRSATSPRLGLIYNPFAGTRFKLIYGTAFRAPNVCELYYQEPSWMKANPNLKPESIKTYELVYEQRLFDSLHLTTAGFYNKIDRLIAQTLDPDDGFTFFDNLDDIEMKGFELEFKGEWDRRFKGRMSYTYQDARDKTTGRTLVNSPKHLVKANFTTHLWKDLLVPGIEMQYVSNRKTLNGTKAGGFFITNLTFLSRKLASNFEISFNVYNLFDRKYSYPASSEYRMNTIEQDGRTFRLKMTYGF
ncbi:MAG: Colicin I receptor precursor [Syntrophorhabdus sp. PtaU1.Bin050]|nr:MAG: Colicin I receptor precursor [Syntrophorhabdus sp. PtaU1.Bin050]